MNSSRKIIFFLYLQSECSSGHPAFAYLPDCRRLQDRYDCTFFDLSEKVGYAELAKRVVAVVEAEAPEICYLIPSTERGIGLRDYVVKEVLCRLGTRCMIHYPENMRKVWWQGVLRKYCLQSQRVVISDWRDYQMVSRYTKKEHIEVCPEVDGDEVTLDMFENKLLTLFDSIK